MMLSVHYNVDVLR